MGDSATRPRVVRIVTRLNVGGPARQAMYLTRALGDRGFSSELVWGASAPREGTLRPPADVPNVHVPTLRRELRPLDDLRASAALHRLVRARRPLVVHTHLAKAGALGRVAARRSRVPVLVHTFHGHVLDGYFSSLATRAIVEAEHRLARWTDALLAVSSATRDELLALGIGTPDRWHVVPVGIELDALLRDGMGNVEGRRALGLPAGGPVIGIVGRLVPIKDHDTFLEMATLVLRSRPDATFVIAGDGEARTRLERRAAAMLGNRIRFLGWVSDLPALYSALDVVVLTSRNEGTPVALIEAGAAARPVVATGVGGVPDVVLDGQTGLLAPSGDAEGLATCVLSLMDAPEGARGMGERARAWVRDRFSAERLADDLTSLYSELLSRKGLVQAR